MIYELTQFTIFTGCIHADIAARLDLEKRRELAINIAQDFYINSLSHSDTPFVLMSNNVDFLTTLAKCISNASKLNPKIIDYVTLYRIGKKCTKFTGVEFITAIEHGCIGKML